MYKFTDKDNETQVETVKEKDVLLLFVRVMGICLFLIGLWAAVHTLLEALSLYKDPGKVAQFASYIEQGMGKPEINSTPAQAEINPGDPASIGQGILNNSNKELTYFIAWVISLLLLFLIASIAFSCIRTGANIVMQSRDRPKPKVKTKTPVTKN